VLTAVTILLYGAAGKLPRIDMQFGPDAVDVFLAQAAEGVKSDYLEEDLYLPAASDGDLSPDAGADDASLPSAVDPAEAVDYQTEPVPATLLRSAELLHWSLILVNTDHPLSSDFRVDLVKINGGYLVDQRVSAPLRALIADAAENGVPLTVCSAFRTVKAQQALIDKKAQSLVVSGLDVDLAYSVAGRYIANPGESEHHTGLAVDFLTDGISQLNENFTGTDAYQWLTDNAYRYGFILRYPKGKEEITHMSFEPWHYRFVGREYAAAIREADLCLEEYLDTAK
jgi:D-alanyl-D-alanine carboxypeptidase